MSTESISPEELDKKESYSPEELDKMEGVQSTPNQVQNPGFDLGKMIQNIPSSAKNYLTHPVAEGLPDNEDQFKNESELNNHVEQQKQRVMFAIRHPLDAAKMEYDNFHPLKTLEDHPVETLGGVAALGKNLTPQSVLDKGKELSGQVIKHPVTSGIAKVAGGAGAAALGHPYIGSGLAIGGLKDIGKSFMDKPKPIIPPSGVVEQLERGQHTIPKVPKFQDLPTPNSTPIIQWHPETPKSRIDTEPKLPQFQDLPMSENPTRSEIHIQKPLIDTSHIIPKTPIIQDLPAARNPLGAESHQPSTPSPREVATRQVQPLTPKPSEVPDTRVSTSRLMVRPPAGIQGPLENLPNSQDLNNKMTNINPEKGGNTKNILIRDPFKATVISADPYNFNGLDDPYVNSHHNPITRQNQGKIETELDKQGLNLNNVNGFSNFSRQGLDQHFLPDMTHVNEPYRRSGIASNIYDTMKQSMKPGEQIRVSPELLPDGEKFRNNYDPNLSKQIIKPGSKNSKYDITSVVD